MAMPLSVPNLNFHVPNLTNSFPVTVMHDSAWGENYFQLDFPILSSNRFCNKIASKKHKHFF